MLAPGPLQSQPTALSPMLQALPSYSTMDSGSLMSIGSFVQNAGTGGVTQLLPEPTAAAVPIDPALQSASAQVIPNQPQSQLQLQPQPQAQAPLQPAFLQTSEVALSSLSPVALVNPGSSQQLLQPSNAAVVPIGPDAGVTVAVGIPIGIAPFPQPFPQTLSSTSITQPVHGAVPTDDPDATVDEDADADAGASEEFPPPTHGPIYLDSAITFVPKERRGPKIRAKLPVPVPNLIKKSRGRRVPIIDKVSLLELFLFLHLSPFEPIFFWTNSFVRSPPAPPSLFSFLHILVLTLLPPPPYN
jgi:hypothetical protein